MKTDETSKPRRETFPRPRDQEHELVEELRENLSRPRRVRRLRRAWRFIARLFWRRG